MSVNGLGSPAERLSGRFTFFLLTAWFVVTSLGAPVAANGPGAVQERDLRGRVIAVDGLRVTIELDGNLQPAIGDRVTLKGQVEGLSTLANLTGNWRVTEMIGLTVTADTEPGPRVAPPQPGNIAIVRTKSARPVAGAAPARSEATLTTIARDGARSTVSGDVLEPVRTDFVAPPYPELARLSRLQCNVTVEAEIDATGAVTDARIARGCNGTRGTALGIHDAALDAVRQWRYQPARRDGEPIAAVLLVTLNFVLR